MSEPSYHDLHITTSSIRRTSIFNLPFSLDVRCCRTTGWQLWQVGEGGPSQSQLLAGEYNDNGLRLDVAGHIIVNTLGHDLWPVGKVCPEAPEQIKDRNDVVVLQLCRRCGLAEAELVGKEHCLGGMP